ncbi:uncharacterized protein LOC143047051 [Mytilus galloprovincialis]|uniref:Uncharacterized protein n=1 Tax=Mytilus galloprovincialis TaxID=29158 RepID=A0A8B6CJH9_MYTGA|nr:Hypothetical predicted protein [Mytilus galloprovincialis]
MHTSTQTQTVITWRNIPATARYIQYENPCLLLIGNALCYIISGLALLVFGVIVTSVTFQNLERHTEGNTERYVGPVLIVVGALLLARGTFNQFHFVETRTRERILIRDCQPTLYSSRQITECSSTTATMCSVSVNEENNQNGRLPTNEDPPPYEVVIADQCLPDSPDTFDIVRITHRWQDELVTTSEGSVASPSNGSEPPSYEEYMKRVSEAQNDT